MRKVSLFATCVVFGLCSCEKDEIAIEPHKPGSSVENQIGMEQDYRSQIFFDLETNEIVSSNLKTEWDLGFETSSEGFHLVLNTAKGMAVHHSNLAFSDLTTSSGLEWSWDAHSGILDSTAIGNWTSAPKLYLIDRGYDHHGAHQGYYKLQVYSFSSSEYSIEYGELNEATPVSLIIPKNTVNTLTYFSFENGVVNIAPEKDKWDLVFTQYTHLFTDPSDPMVVDPYVVTGVLLNRYESSAGKIDNISFADVSYHNAQNLELSTDLNSIGYDWKWYDYDAGSYVVDPDMVFVILTSDGYYYKLHFIDFYNESGEKGYPKFEFEQL